MNELSTKIQDAIKENLPGAVANELQTFIQDAKVDKSSLATAIRDVKDLMDQVKKLTKLKNSKEKLDEQKEKLNEKAEELDKKERELQLTLKDLEIQMLKQNNTVVVDLVGVMFKNPRIIEKAQGTVQTPGFNHDGYQTGSGFTTTDITTTIEETKDDC